MDSPYKVEIHRLCDDKKIGCVVTDELKFIYPSLADIPKRIDMDDLDDISRKIRNDIKEKFNQILMSEIKILACQSSSVKDSLTEEIACMKETIEDYFDKFDSCLTLIGKIQCLVCDMLDINRNISASSYNSVHQDGHLDIFDVYLIVK